MPGVRTGGSSFRANVRNRRLSQQQRQRANAEPRYNRAMKTSRQLTAIIEREDDSYVAFCPELDIASQGDTVEQARTNLVEALELFFETADQTEVERRL